EDVCPRRYSFACIRPARINSEMSPSCDWPCQEFACCLVDFLHIHAVGHRHRWHRQEDKCLTFGIGGQTLLVGIVWLEGVGTAGGQDKRQGHSYQMISTHYLTPKKHSPLETWQREPKLVNVLHCTRMLQQGVQNG